jgi:gamma-glutamylaminecyclotransferase
MLLYLLRGATLEKQLLFVYGSLKKGFRNESVLKDADFITDNCVTCDEFEMYPCRDYTFPYLFKTNRDVSKNIKGELYEVDSNFLDVELDNFEGVFAGLFQRETISINLRNNEKLRVQAYIVATSDRILGDIDMTPTPLNEWSKENNQAGLLVDYYKKGLENGL